MEEYSNLKDINVRKIEDIHISGSIKEEQNKIRIVRWVMVIIRINLKY